MVSADVGQMKGVDMRQQLAEILRKNDLRCEKSDTTIIRRFWSSVDALAGENAAPPSASNVVQFAPRSPRARQRRPRK
jgi:hypothetical protein